MTKEYEQNQPQSYIFAVYDVDEEGADVVSVARAD